MRIFIHYDKNGHILSVAQTISMTEDLEHPFILTDETEGILEVQEDDPIAKLECHEIHNRYIVDMTKKKLKKKS